VSPRLARRVHAGDWIAALDVMVDEMLCDRRPVRVTARRNEVTGQTQYVVTQRRLTGRWEELAYVAIPDWRPPRWSWGRWTAL
jgi:hypothetical protein